MEMNMNFNKPEYNRILITLTRRMMMRLSESIPVLYNKAKNEEMFHEQNVAMMQTHNYDVFDILKMAIEYLNPVTFAILKDETLRTEVTKNAVPTNPEPARVPLIRVLLLQEDKEPHLIAFGINDSCINDILDVLQIPYKNKTLDIIPFDYFTLNYIIILKSRSFHEVFIKMDDCLVNNDPSFFVFVMEFIQFTTKILHFSRSSIVHAYPKPNVNGCSHGCNFRKPTSSCHNTAQDSNFQKLLNAARATYVPPLCSNPAINRKYTELMHMLYVAKNYHRF